MKVANNMDSVFADCTKDELEFDLMFDDDDCLIDLVAGVDESGELVTGENPEDTYKFQLDKDGNDPLEDKDDTARREGEVKDTSDNVEGAKQEEVCKECGKPISECVCSVSESIIARIKANRRRIEEEVDTSSETDDTFEKGINAEGGEKSEGPLEDKDDTARREGEVKDTSDNVEGAKQEEVGAAQEGVDDIDSQLSDSETVPDDVQTDGSSNTIPTDAETQSSDGVQPSTEGVVYTGWIGNITEAAKKESEEEKETTNNTQEDDDIEMVQNGDFESDSELDLDVDYDDDELIDIAINGENLD